MSSGPSLLGFYILITVVSLFISAQLARITASYTCVALQGRRRCAGQRDSAGILFFITFFSVLLGAALFLSRAPSADRIFDDPFLKHDVQRFAFTVPWRCLPPPPRLRDPGRHMPFTCSIRRWWGPRLSLSSSDQVDILRLPPTYFDGSGPALALRYL